MLGFSQLQSDLYSLSWELASFLFPLTSLLKPNAAIIWPQLHDIIASLHEHGRAWTEVPPDRRRTVFSSQLEPAAQLLHGRNTNG